jgi:hypothetical protein
MPCGARELLDFHNNETDSFRRFLSTPVNAQSGNPCLARVPQENALWVCTKSGHRVVDGLHVIEKTDSYEGEFSIDGKNRRSTTRLFFDSFLSFSGWCGVRGSSRITFLIARLGRRVSKGL